MKSAQQQRVKKTATRDGFGDALLEAGQSNENIVALTADLSESTRTHLFAKAFPKRFFEVGIAEQNMAGIAAGLALSGKIPFMSSFAVFSPGRNWDQIRLSICYSQANVKIIGSHGGFSNGGDGANAQALEDIALMRVLPNMVVLHPADYIETKKAVFAAIKHVGPVYIRLMREPTPVFTDAGSSFEIGKSTVLAEGTDVTIIGTGPVVYDALMVAQELKKEKGISCEVINCASIKPLDKKTILESAKKTGKVITVEEHQVYGGLGGAVCELLAQEFPVPVKIIGVSDTFGESGDYVRLKDKYGISTDHIKKAISQLI
jgi:transketolase